MCLCCWKYHNHHLYFSHSRVVNGKQCSAASASLLPSASSTLPSFVLPFVHLLPFICPTVSLSSYTFLLSLFSSSLPSVVWHLYPTMRCCRANILGLPSASFSFSLVSPVRCLPVGEDFSLQAQQ